MFHGKLIYRRSCAGKIVCEFRFRSKEIRCTYLAYPFSSRHPPLPPVPFLEIKCKFLYYSWQFRLMSRRPSNYFANFVRGETCLNNPPLLFGFSPGNFVQPFPTWRRAFEEARETDTFFAKKSLFFSCNILLFNNFV